MKNLYKFPLIALAVLSLGSCKKDDTKVATPKPKAELYFSAKIDGTDYLVEALVDGYGSGAGASGGTGDVPGTYEELQSMLFINPTTEQGAGISIIKMFNGRPYECDSIEAMYRTGTYTFGREERNNVPGKNGVVIFYVDKNKTHWSSDFGSGDQTGSRFEIVEHKANNDFFSRRISKATFNCKLYDGNGNSKVLTNGEIKGRSVTCDHL